MTSAYSEEDRKERHVSSAGLNCRARVCFWVKEGGKHMRAAVGEAVGRLSESEIGSAMGAGVGSETVAIVYFEPLLHLDSLLLVNLEFLLASL